MPNSGHGPRGPMRSLLRFYSYAGILSAVPFLLFCLLPGGAQAFGGLQVTCPEGPSRVYVDGVYIGKTPLYTSDIHSGEHGLEVRDGEGDTIWKGNVHVPVISTVFVKAVRPDRIYELDRIRRRNRLLLVGGAALSTVMHAQPCIGKTSIGYELINELLNRPAIALDPKSRNFVSRRNQLEQQAMQSPDGGPPSPEGLPWPYGGRVEVTVEDDMIDEPAPVLQLINYTTSKLYFSFNSRELTEAVLAPLERRKYTGFSGTVHCTASLDGLADWTRTIEIRPYREFTFSVRRASGR